MKHLVFITVMALTLSFTSCSLFKKKKNTASNSGEIISDEFEELAGEEIVLDDEGTLESDDVEIVEVESSDLNGDIVQSGSYETGQQAVSHSDSSNMGTYTVKKNETLMMVAFKIYGDYDYWRKLKSVNGLRSTRLSTGQRISYPMPANKFSWNPQGTPYIIRHGDSLSKISSKVYGSYKYWNDIYQNNRPMIKRADLIFAGFTLYYPSKSRVMASK